MTATFPSWQSRRPARRPDLPDANPPWENPAGPATFRVFAAKPTVKGQSKPDWSSFLHQGVEEMARCSRPAWDEPDREMHAALNLIEKSLVELSLDTSGTGARRLLYRVSMLSPRGEPEDGRLRHALYAWPSGLPVRCSLQPRPRPAGRATCGIRPPGQAQEAQQLLLDGRIPGEMAFSLHVSLIRHGQEICTSGKPQCHRCPLRGFLPTTQGV